MTATVHEFLAKAAPPDPIKIPLRVFQFYYTDASGGAPFSTESFKLNPRQGDTVDVQPDGGYVFQIHAKQGGPVISPVTIRVRPTYLWVEELEVLADERPGIPATPLALQPGVH